MCSNINQLLRSAQDALEAKNLKEAEKYLRDVIKADPENCDAFHTFGIIEFTKGNISEALENFRKAARDNENTTFLFNYASTLLESGQYSEALREFSKLLKILPDHIPTLNKCITILGKMGELTVAQKMCGIAIKLDSSNTDTFNNLGNLCKDQGKVEEALDYYRKALSIKPDNETAGSNLLLCFNYLNKDPQKVFIEHREWELRNRPGNLIIESVNPPVNTDREQLSIGYISADFRTHSVGCFIEPIIKNHNREKFRIFCYADISSPDKITQRIKRSAFKWRSIYNVDDGDIISMIKKDGIDILVDLAGHSGRNKLSVFLYKPAPISVTYLGYPNTTGISTIDYRLTDALADPYTEDRYYTENLYRLPLGFLCFKPPENIPKIEETPVIKNGYITFGSFNNLAKINSRTISIWSEILKKVPESKLTIKSKPFNDKNIIQNFCKMFASEGIDMGRLHLKGHSLSTKEHLGEYNGIDIALDTFPYNGATTTCEALLMGTPVITLLGERHASRVGGSILSNVSIPELIANNQKEYISIASRLSKDIQSIIRLNRILKRDFQSKMCDGEVFTKSLENAYLNMWNRYCSKR